MMMHPQTIEAQQLFHDGALALARAERAGIRVDVEYYQQTSTYLEKRIARSRQKLEASELAKTWKRAYRQDVNFDSDPQLSRVLYGVMKIEPTKTTEKGNPSVDLEALENLDVPGLVELLEIRKYLKLKDTYIKGMLNEQIDGYIHPFFHLHTVRTMRSSSAAPNFQNQPNRDPESKKLIRRGIKARPGHMLLAGDFKGIEVSVGHAYHLDPNMKIYLEDKSTDMHRDTAMKCFMLAQEEVLKAVRHTSKNKFVFPEFYGDYYASCAKAMWSEAQKDTHITKSGIQLIKHLSDKGIKTYKQFEDHIKQVEDWFWNTRFAVYTQWKEDHLKLYHMNGYVDYKTGFRIYGLMDRKQAINYPIQGSAFHVLLWCFIQLDRISKEQNWRSRLIGQIHDEIVMDVWPGELDMLIATLHDIMSVKVREHWNWITVPMEIEIETCPVDGSLYDKAPYENGSSPK